MSEIAPLNCRINRQGRNGGESADQSLLWVENLDVYYGDFQVLWGISMHVHAGEVVAIVGPNGSGKTTLLKTIQGLLHPARGAIYLNGQRIDRFPVNHLVEQGIAMIPEGRLLFPEMSVRENLELGAYPLRARSHTLETLELVYDLFPNLRAKQSQRASALSGGEQQMIAIGRGLMSRPRLLMLDDPFLGLARRIMDHFCNTLAKVNQDGTTILMAGQHVRRLLMICNWAYLLEAGRVVHEGPGQELLESEELRRALLTVPGEEKT